MKTAVFDGDGGPIVWEVTPVPQRDGAYEVKLWAANENAVVRRWLGNFINTDDDRHALDGPNAPHHGRIIELVATVSVPPGTGPCTVSLIITQDGNELARDLAVIAPNTPAGLVNLFMTLERAS